MTIPSMWDLTSYTPRWPAVRELNLNDEWRARWVDEEVLPAGAPVLFAYGAVFCGDRGYAVRPAGQDVPWGALEVTMALGDDPAAAVAAAASERTGAVVAQTVLVGFLECRATSHNPDFPVGTTTVRPLYVVVAQEVGDLPEGSPWERRRFLIADYLRALRTRYPELDAYFGLAGQRYLVLRSHGGGRTGQGSP